jgi:hypothetical protein
MNIVRTIDLWTEQIDNHEDVIIGAFVDGFESGIPYDTYHVIKNCNCIITSSNPLINITNKHSAVVFYKNNIPVRLMVINKNTDLEKYINIALNQQVKGKILKNILNIIGVKRADFDFHQAPIINNCNHDKEIDVGSCDRDNLLSSMLEGSYTESETEYGKSNKDTEFRLIPINIEYNLLTANEQFIITHHVAFINKDNTRIIPLQDNSHLDIEEIYKEYYNKDELGK